MEDQQRWHTTARTLLTLVCLLGITAAGAQPPGRGGPAPRDVRIVNTPAQAVPVTPQGTVSVQGDVSVTNTPDVNVLSLPPVPLAGTPPVVIDNGPGEEVPVRESGLPAFRPWHATVFVEVPAGQSSNTVILSNEGLGVPAGKRLVIETITAQAIVPREQTPFISLTLAVEGAGVPGGFMTAFPSIELTRMGEFDGVRDHWAATHAVRLYANQVSVRMARAPGNALLASLSATISGHLVDLP